MQIWIVKSDHSYCIIAQDFDNTGTLTIRCAGAMVFRHFYNIYIWQWIRK